MHKGVSPILASVLVILVVLSMAGAFLVYSQRTATQLTESATTQQQTLQQRLDVKFSIASVANNVVYVKNLGSQNITQSDLSVFIDDIPANFTLAVPITPEFTGTVYLNKTWQFGLGERTLRVVGGLSDSARVRIDRPAGNVLDLRFDENQGNTTFDSSPYAHRGNFSGMVIGDFEETMDGFTADCNNGTTAFVSGHMGKAIQLWSSGIGDPGNNEGCIYKMLANAATPGYTIWFYGKGHVGAGLYNGTQHVSYLQDVQTGCSTANGQVFISQSCNGGNPYDNWRLFRLIVFTNSVSAIRPYFYGRENGIGPENAGYYDYVTEGPTWAEGKFGKAINFDGTDDYVDFGDVLDVGTQSFTVELWTKVTDDTSGPSGRKLINKGWTTSGVPPEAGYAIRVWNDRTLQFGIADATGMYNYTNGTTALNLNQWYHITMTVNRDANIVLYIDGEKDKQIVTTGTNSLDTNVPLAVGALERASPHATTEFFPGTIDEVRVYDRAYVPDELYVVNRA